jgi:hypothetical protein
MTTRRQILASVAACTAPDTAATPKGPLIVPFAPSPGGGPLDGFSIALTGGGRLPDWAAMPDPDQPGAFVFAQSSTDPTDYRFPLAIYNRFFAAVVDVSVRFKAVAGSVDWAAGIAIRLTDPTRYYGVRANALEDNVNFYRVGTGGRRKIQGADTKVPSSVWHTPGLRAEGDRFAVSFNGKTLFTATDRTIAGPGKVALWTKADSVTWFAGLSLQRSH